MILGAKAEYRRRGIFAVFANEMFERAKAFGFTGAEASWILEDNDKLNRPLTSLGAKEYRRWRIYDRPHSERHAHMSIFEKCDSYTLAREVQAMGIYPYFTPIEETTATEARIDGDWKIMVGSNNYLGLTHHPKVLGRARRAALRYGVGSTGSRFLNGTLDLHYELEARLATFFREASGARVHDGLSSEPRRARDRCSAANDHVVSSIDSTTRRSSTARDSASASCIGSRTATSIGLARQLVARAKRRGKARRDRRRVLDGRHASSICRGSSPSARDTAPRFSSTKRTRSACSATTAPGTVSHFGSA